MITEGAARPVARKLSVRIPGELLDGIDARRGTASYGAYLRSLLGVARMDEQQVPAAVRVVCRAARPLPPGTLDGLVHGPHDTTELVEFVPDVQDLAERWSESYWEGMAPGEIGWVLLGLDADGSSGFTARRDAELAFGELRRLFRDANSDVRVVLHPFFAFRHYVRGRRLGEARWVDCDERESDAVVLAVRIEASVLPRS